MDSAADSLCIALKFEVSSWDIQVYRDNMRTKEKISRSRRLSEIVSTGEPGPVAVLTDENCFSDSRKSSGAESQITDDERHRRSELGRLLSLCQNRKGKSIGGRPPIHPKPKRRYVVPQPTNSARGKECPCGCGQRFKKAHMIYHIQVCEHNDGTHTPLSWWRSRRTTKR